MEINPYQGDGDSWTVVDTYVYYYSWGEDINEIFYISVADEYKNGDQTNNLQVQRFFVTLNGGESNAFVSEEGVFAFVYSYGTIYAAKYDNQTGKSDLYLTNSDFSNGPYGDPFIPAQFRGSNSVEHIDSSLYLILNDADGVSFLAVCNSEYSMVASLYQANIDNGLYWLNRPHLRATCDSRHFKGADFQRIHSLDATYFTNGYPDAAFDQSGSSIENYIQSAISFNKGGSWSYLTAPDNQNCVKPNCSLHLFSFADDEMIYSTEEAVGIVIAQGNMGQYRKPITDSSTGLFLSRNGGYTWNHLKTGRFLVSSSNHASVIVLVPKGETNEFLYSWDQGESWSQCLFASDNVQVEYLLNRMEDESTFILIGKGMDGNSGIIVTITIPHAPVCEGFALAGTPNSDYELFSQQVGDSCILGQDVTYTRRKQDSACLNDSEERRDAQGACQCARLDYTCDGDCFKQAIDENGDVVCVNDCVGLPNDPQAPPANCTGTYTPPSGYRLVDGDYPCVDGLQYSVSPIPCPQGVSPSPTISASMPSTPSSTVSASLSSTPTISPSAGSSGSTTSSMTPTNSKSFSPTPTPTPTPTPSSTLEANNGTTSSATPTISATSTISFTQTPAATVNPVPPAGDTTTDGSSAAMIIGGIFLAIMIILILGVIILILLYKFNPK